MSETIVVPKIEENDHSVSVDNSEGSINTPTTEDIQEWLISYIANLQKISKSSIDVDAPLDNYALNSVAALTMAGDLEIWLDREFDPTVVWDYPTIEKLSDHLAHL